MQSFKNLSLLQDFCSITYITYQNFKKIRDHVYFVHPSTDISVDISTDSRPIYRSTYRSTLDRYVGRHIGRELTDMSTDICRSTYRLMYRSICRPTLDRYVGRYVDREWLSTCRLTCRSIGDRHSADTSLPWLRDLEQSDTYSFMSLS